MLPTSRTHPRLHRRNPQINFLIVTNHRYVLKDSDLFFSQHFKKIVGRFNGHTIETTKSTLHSIAVIRSPIHPCPIANTKTLLSQVQSIGSYPPFINQSREVTVKIDRRPPACAKPVHLDAASSVRPRAARFFYGGLQVPEILTH